MDLFDKLDKRNDIYIIIFVTIFRIIFFPSSFGTKITDREKGDRIKTQCKKKLSQNDRTNIIFII